MMTLTVMLPLIMARIAAAGDNSGFMAAVLGLTGCLDVEELDGYDVERYYDFYEKPLCLNYAPRSALLASGLMSAYQVSVLVDHRDISGDILSYEELSALDGFGHDFVSALRYFVSLDSSSSPGQSSSSPPVVRNTLTLRSAVRNTVAGLSPQGMYAAKYRITVGEYFDAGFSMRSSWQDGHFPPDKYSFFAAFYGRKSPWKIVVGDFSLRFGQGLAMWPGFTVGGVSSPEAFSRRPSGIVPYNSYSGEGAFRGLAADFGSRNLCVSVFAAGLGLREMMQGEDDFRNDILYGLGFGWYGMSGQVSMTCFAVSPMTVEVPAVRADEPLPAHVVFPVAKLSADARFSIRGTYIFGEAAYDISGGRPAFLAGVRRRISDSVQAAAMARYYPPGYSAEYSGAARSGTQCTNEHGMSVSVSHSAGRWVDIAGKTGFGSSERRFHGVVSADAAYSREPKYGVDTSSFQFKFILSENVRISPALSIGFRVSERYRSYGQPFRTDIRSDLRCTLPGWSINMRLNILHCEDFSYLSYLEGGYAADVLTLWLRSGFFRVDSWNDRIYAYERDAPGSFSVPAYYGRGYWVALTGVWKFSRGIRLYFRASFQDYPWPVPPETEKKPAKAEIRLQLAFDIWKSGTYRRNS